VHEVAREFERRARESDFLAVVDDDGEHRARSLVAQARGLSLLLESAGQSAPTVLLQADNSWRTVAATVAIGRLGGVVALISRHSTRAEFDSACQDIRPDAIVGDVATVGEWGAAPALAATEAYDVLRGWVMYAARAARPIERWRGGGVIGLTSGSTGRAKGVVQSEAALRYACSHTIATTRLEVGDPVAGIVPLSSVAAYCFGLYLPLLLGSPVVYWRKWDPAATAARMVERDVRWSMCVPTMALQLAAAGPAPGALHRLRAITVGGGPMDRGALERAEQALGTKVLRVFGMSECLGHTTPGLDDDIAIRLGRDGRAFPGTEVRAVDADGQALPVGESGRAQVKGPSLFLGYARHGEVEPPQLTEDGFFPTGDLVVANPDGTINVMGREKDVIIRGGRNIDITEVEMAVASHPLVSQVCVVPVPDELLGERIAALVVSLGGHLDLAEVTRHLAERGVAKTKWPEFIFEVPEIPQTRVGKHARAEARELASTLLAMQAPSPVA
jgi:acyl-CoA synthetase (AMP-forming)/AMP-acid ligase II